MPAITGSYLSSLFDTKVGQDYSGYLAPTRKNRLFRDALLKVAEDSYRGIESQKIRDEMGFIISSESTFLVQNNNIYTAPLQITNVTVVSTTATFTTYLPHNLQVGNVATVSGITGTLTFASVTNGSRTVLTTPSSTTFTATVSAATGVYSSGGQITAVLSAAAGSPILIPDYWHLLNMKCYFTKRVYSLAVSNATNATPIVIKLNKYNNLRSYDSILIASVGGNTNANGTHYIKKENDFYVSLYSDSTLQTGIAGNGSYTSGGVISKTYFNQAKPYFPKTKISSLNEPTVDHPRFEHAKRMLKVYPRTDTCSSIELDYVRQPDVAIDTADTIVDLTMYYPEKVLYHIVDVAAEQFGMLTRDPEMMKIAQTEISENP